MQARLLVLASLALFASANAGVVTKIKPHGSLIQQGLAGDRTITKVVKLLQGLLDKSKAESDTERDLYAKFKCYCDTSEEEKKTSIEQLTKEIGLLENKIASLQGSNGGLSSECAKLKADMAANEAARNEATTVRNQEHEDFLALEADLTQAIGQMNQAIDVLSAIGADQTLNTATDHTKFMAGYNQQSLVKLDAKVKAALVAASSFMSPKEKQPIDAFLQAPFTGNYASQSGQVVGILKNMLDTFTANLASARSTEAAQLKSYNEFMAAKLAEYEAMEASYNEKQTLLSANDAELASSKSSLEAAQQQKASDEAFLEQLLPMCAAKGKDYEERKMLRANEQAAISEAIAILNSDAAFSTFGTVSATSTGATEASASFLQVASSSDKIRRNVEQILRQTAKKEKSMRIAKIAALLQAGNPFDVVLAEIDKIIALIAEEGKADQDNLNWCNSERTANDAELETKNEEILGLNTEITDLDNTINDPETGLKAQIQGTEESLVQNSESQKTETETRREENQAYQKDIANIVESERLLKKAITVLDRYYSKILAKLESSLVQKGKEDPAPPSTWEGEYEGQSGAGNQVIQMLQFILSEAEKEETEAHQAENEAQTAYEDSMGSLKSEEAQLQQSLATLQESLAEAEKSLMEKRTDLEKTEAAKKAIEEYLLKIKPGCDFITANFDLRETHRATEKEALENAIDLIKGTPAYQSAVAEAHVASLGDCASKCEADEENVVCKACLAEVTVPGYCAGHPDTAGCDAVGAPAAA